MKNRVLLLCLLALLAVACSGCAKQGGETSAGVCRALIEQGQGFVASPRYQEITPGQDAVFHITVNSGGAIAGVDYPDYTLETKNGKSILTLKKVRYSAVVSLTLSHTYITYHANGGQSFSGSGQVQAPVSDNHIGLNTALGTTLFHRKGYLLTGWNTQSDGQGTPVGLGSRAKPAAGLVLYAQWAKCSSPELFAFAVENGVACITGYTGKETLCVIPETLQGYPVKKIGAYAFANAGFDTLVLPPTIHEVEKAAFYAGALQTIYCYDTIGAVHDDSFEGCDKLQTLHINAARAPAYSGTYYDTFPDKMDRLMSLQNQKKLVLFSGSSARFGYDSEQIHKALAAYQVVNMGVYAYTNALPQLELIRTQMQPGDILLEAPEFDAVPMQFCVSNSLDQHFFRMTEANYDLVALLDLRRYTDVFSSFGLFLSERSPLEEKAYSISAADYDEEGNGVGFKTYNDYGDFIYPRPNGSGQGMLRYIQADYTQEAFLPQTVQSLNRALEPFVQKGVWVYFSYAPRNIHSLTPQSTPQARRQLHEFLVEALAVPVISELEASLYPASCFYEIDNHLSTQGVALRTAQTIDDLMQQMKQDKLL